MSMEQTNVPSGWELTSGSDIYDVNPNPKPESNPNTYIEMDALDIELPWPKYFGERNAEDYSGKTFQSGDTLFARITPCTENGKAALVPDMDTKVGIGSTEFAVLSPKEERISPLYLYYLSKSHQIHNYAVSRMRGSTGRQRVPFSVFRRELEIPLPPKPEQRKIASILYTVDQAIQKTEEIIEQTKRVKKGLMQDFFGVFNPIRERDNPAEVDLFELTDIVELANGHAFSTDNLSDNEEGFKVIRISNLTNHDHEFWYYDGDIEGKCIVTDGDLLFSWAGMKTSIGVHLWGGDTSLLNQHIYKIVPTDVLSKEYLYYYLDYVMKDIHSLSQGGAVQIHLTKSEIERIKVPFLAEDERESIVQNLQLLDRIQKINYKQKVRLMNLKKGLMQDLLTGAVRTHDKDIEVLDEVKEHG